jgi:hypothetical protein
MKKIAFAHASRRDHYKLIADSRVEGIGNSDFALRRANRPSLLSVFALAGVIYGSLKLLVRFDQIARFIANANHSRM